MDQHSGAGAAQPSANSAIDPVCGMTVDPATARTRDLHLQVDGIDYYFCGRGCKLEFGEDPGRFLAADYTPSM
ncbi:MAG: YHS domain-containing protein [Candidatus Limnocylindrales bacterium]